MLFTIIKFTDMKINILLLFAILVMGCNEQNEEANGVDESTAQHDTFDIPISQMEANGMQVTQVLDTSMSANIIVAGTFVNSMDGIYEFSTPINAKVTEVRVMNGSDVRRGQTLFRLESNELVDLEQQLLEDKAQLEYWKEEEARQFKLVEANAGASKVYSDARSKVAAINARIAGAEQKLQRLGIDVTQVSTASINGFFNIAATFDGQVSDIMVHNGQVINAMSSLCIIRNPSKLTIEANVFASDRDKIMNGQQVTFRLNNIDTTFYGRVLTASISADQLSKSYKLMIEPSSNHPSFFEGRTTQVAIQMKNQKVLAIPSAAVGGNPEAPFVFELISKENDSMAFKKKFVTVILRTEELNGIAPTDLSDNAYILSSGIHLLTFE